MVTFSHPYTTPTTTLILRNPELGNSVQIDNQVSFKKTMSGTLRTTIRPVHERLVITFQLLKNAEIAGLVSFIKTVRAAEFRYTDHLGQSHKCRFPMSNYAYNWIGRYSRVIQLQLELVE